MRYNDTITYNEFIRRFGRPLKSGDGSIYFKSCGADYDKMQSANVDCVWIFGRNYLGSFIAPASYCLKRSHYIITPKPRSAGRDYGTFLLISERQKMEGDMLKAEYE